MLIYANGCSMTLGTELAHPISSAFPALLANHFGVDLLNVGYGGASNCRILRTSLMWITDYIAKGHDPKNLFMLIGWTAPTRREFALAEEEGSLDPNEFWRDIFVHCRMTGASRDLVKLHKLVFTSFACDRESMARFLVAASSLQGVLADYGVRYCFMHAMPVQAVHPELVPLAGMIDQSRFFRFLQPEGDFFSMSQDRWRVPLGEQAHPLEEGHRRWSVELIDFIEKGGLL